MRLLVVLLGLWGASASAYQADEMHCEEERTSGWFFYCDPEVIEEETEGEREAEPDVVAIPEPTPEPLPFETAKQQIEAFRAEVDELKFRAVLDPTYENVRAYMEMNKVMATMARAFTTQWQSVLFDSPHLDANVKNPLVAMGAQIRQDQIAERNQRLLREVAQNGGLMFVHTDPAQCGACRGQAEILADLEREYGISILAVAKDGVQIEGLGIPVLDTGQLAALGLDEIPTPFMAMVDTETKEVHRLGAGLLSREHILTRIAFVYEHKINGNFGARPKQ